MSKGLRRYPKAEFALPMLPGFRFLFAAIVLSMSIMVFGLGAAALLRTAHEEFASNPSWRAAPETTFAQQSESRVPVLAMLRVDPLPAEQKVPDDVPAVEPPVASASGASAPAEPEKTAASSRGACRHGGLRNAAGSRLARAWRDRRFSKRPTRSLNHSLSRQRHEPAEALLIRSDRSRPAVRRADPIRPMSRHRARYRGRRADKAPASQPTRRRRSRRWSRSVWSGRRRHP